MNAEQKQRAIAALTKWGAADSNKAVLSTGYEMAGVLQELIDAPEPEQPNQSEQHLEMVNAPAPSVPDDFYNAVANLSVELEELVAETSGVYGLHLNGDPSPWEEILEGGRFERISSLHVVQNLLATRQPKQPEQPAQPAELVRDAERYRWLRERYWNDSPLCVISKPKSNCLPGSYFPRSSFLDEEIDAAIERDEMKGGA